MALNVWRCHHPHTNTCCLIIVLDHHSPITSLQIFSANIINIFNIIPVAGDYTLVNIPWSGATSLAFNDSTAATISTLGNAALLVGGLYLLSGFPSALARSDPFGVQRRFGKPAPPAKMFRPRGEQEKERKRGRKKVVGRYQRQRGVERRGPGGVRQGAEERTLPQFSLPETERQLRAPQLPQLPQFRPFQLRMPSLPQIRLPSFPGLRRPARPTQSRPRPAPAAAQPSQSSPPSPPAPQSARPARPAGASQSPRPAPRPQSVRPAATPVQAARPPLAPAGGSTGSPGSIIPPVQEQSVVQSSAPLNLPNPRPAAPSDFGGAFDTDPFQEFQTAE